MEDAPRFRKPTPPKNLRRKRRQFERRRLKRQQRQDQPTSSTLDMSRRSLLIMVGALLGHTLAHQYPSFLLSKLRQSQQSSLVPDRPETDHNPYNPGATSNSPTFASNTDPSTGTTTVPSSPVRVERISIAGVPLYRTVINLRDPDTFISIGLAKNATKANSGKSSVGDEPFKAFVQRYPAAVLANGTFFSLDEEKRVMGNMVSEGRFLKYSRWENYGTTLGLRSNNQAEMITARIEGRPEWNQHWFSITGGPRLLKQGKIWIAPKSEGFRDPHVLGVGTRMALGFPKGGDQLILASFLRSLSLEQEAKAMKALGCYEAMNFDGGTSVALAHRGQLLLDAKRPLTNVLVVYDAEHPAPPSLKASWQRFQRGERPVARR